MHQWNWVCLTESSVGTATTVASKDTRLQSVKLVIKHQTPTNAHLISRLHQDQISNKKISKKLVLIYLECYKLSIKYFA